MRCDNSNLIFIRGNWRGRPEGSNCTPHVQKKKADSTLLKGGFQGMGGKTIEEGSGEAKHNWKRSNKRSRMKR